MSEIIQKARVLWGFRGELSGEIYSEGWRAKSLGYPFPKAVQMNLNSIVSLFASWKIRIQKAACPLFYFFPIKEIS